MASNQEQEQKIDFSVFGKELLQMPQHIHEVYGSLLNNGLYVFQPKCLMKVDVVRYAMQCHFDQVRSVYVQSPQVAYVNLCIGNDLLTDEFKNHFFTGVHIAHYPNSLVKYCDVIFHPLCSQATPDHIYSFALTIAEGKELPGFNLHYFYRNPEWNLSSRPKILTLPEIDDDLDFVAEDISFGFYISMIILLQFGLFRIFYSVSFVPFD